jgi:DNA repair photolyase
MENVGCMMIREVCARAILSKSKIYEYTINPYAGCQHACSYCYARFMKKFSGHTEAWGGYIDAKVNAADLLRKEIIRKKPGRVWISGVCDPYQPLEKKYELTRRCLEILIRNDWPVTLQTRSPLVIRDVELLRNSANIETGFSIPTADDKIRFLFEPGAPSIELRLQALGQLHEAGIRTFAMIAPALPGAEKLVKLLPGKVDRVMIDRMNYHYADWVYRKYGLESYLRTEYFSSVAEKICSGLRKDGVDCQAFC